MDCERKLYEKSGRAFPKERNGSEAVLFCTVLYLRIWQISRLDILSIPGSSAIFQWLAGTPDSIRAFSSSLGVDNKHQEKDRQRIENKYNPAKFLLSKPLKIGFLTLVRGNMEVTNYHEVQT